MFAGRHCAPLCCRSAKMGIYTGPHCLQGLFLPSSKLAFKMLLRCSDIFSIKRDGCVALIKKRELPTFPIHFSIQIFKYPNIHYYWYLKSLNAPYHPLSLVLCMAWRLCRQSKTESTVTELYGILRLDASDLSLVVMLGLEAARILNNLTDQKVNVSATVILHCDAAGTPAPLVLWTKNNQTVVEGSGEAGGLPSKIKQTKKQDRNKIIVK